MLRDGNKVWPVICLLVNEDPVRGITGDGLAIVAEVDELKIAGYVFLER